jgi:hypothetical protein
MHGIRPTVRVSPLGVASLAGATWILQVVVIAFLLCVLSVVVVALSPLVLLWWAWHGGPGRHEAEERAGRRPRTPGREVDLEELFPSAGRW